MVNPADLIAALVTTLQGMSDVVAAVGGDYGRIMAYEDEFPGSTSYQRAVYEAPKPSILVAYAGTDAGTFGRSSVWNHRFTLILKTDGKYTTLITAIANGIPAGSSLNFRRMTIHDSCYPIGPIRFERRTLFVSDNVSIDYFDAALTLPERGDA